MKQFHCSIWGEIEVSELALSIIDTFIFQRLHYIKQTGLAYKVFPNAVGTRFSHSLGVYHLTKTIINEIQLKNKDIEISERKKELISIVGLIHDLGHGPFSHLFDKWLENKITEGIAKQHEQRSIDLFKLLVENYNIKLSNDEVEWICQRVHNPPNDNWFDTLVCNPYSSFDTDKLDYIVRDSFYFGLSHGININRILKNILVIDNKLCFCERIQDEIETLFILREKMHRSIYRHPTIEKIQYFLLQQLYLFDISDYADFLYWNDLYVLMKIPRHKWIELEERNFKQLSFKKIEFNDQQKNVAFKNLWFYNRKNPTKCFHISF
jgi:HD superfamily phosphohydrolase